MLNINTWQLIHTSVRKFARAKPLKWCRRTLLHTCENTPKLQVSWQQYTCMQDAEWWVYFNLLEIPFFFIFHYYTNQRLNHSVSESHRLNYIEMPQTLAQTSFLLHDHRGYSNVGVDVCIYIYVEVCTMCQLIQKRTVCAVLLCADCRLPYGWVPYCRAPNFRVQYWRVP